MKFTKLFRVALTSVWSNKVRSFLTMLGIIIGISSVIILVGMGQGSTKAISDQIESLGTNLITVNIMNRRVATISDSEIADLKTKPGIKEIAPVVTGNVNIKAGSKSSTTNMEATTVNYTEIRKISVAAGRFLMQRDIDNRYNVLVIGTETADTLFSSTNVVGQTMYVNGVEFTIVGVLQSSGTSSSGSNDDRIIVPLSTGERLLKSAQPTTFYVEASSKDQVDMATSYLTLFLNKKYKISTATTSTSTTRSYYRVMSQTSLLTTATSTTQTMTSMLAGIAAISLLVGGIGIMNIML
ncbi:MAG: ABC transporter permease, partial [Bacillota bacterium]|nr:ABC transporter permease [Bacillota bacterium]